MQHDVTRLVIVRHGETAWNLDTRIQGHTDIPLNERGLWQARQAGLALRDEGIDAIYSSDLRRAADTAEAIARACGLSVQLDAGLRERHFGRFEGLTHDEISAQWPEEARRWRQRDPDYGPEGGEVLTHFYERAVGTARRLALAHPGQTVALVAHGGVLDCFYRAATHVGMSAPRSWQIANASINRLIHSPEGFGLIGWADTRHLDEPGGEGLDETTDGATAGSAPGPFSHAGLSPLR
jgi:probable phosphoglycerate mutase